MVVLMRTASYFFVRQFFVGYFLAWRLIIVMRRASFVPPFEPPKKVASANCNADEYPHFQHTYETVAGFKLRKERMPFKDYPFVIQTNNLYRWRYMNLSRPCSSCSAPDTPPLTEEYCSIPSFALFVPNCYPPFPFHVIVFLLEFLPLKRYAEVRWDHNQASLPQKRQRTG